MSSAGSEKSDANLDYVFKILFSSLETFMISCLSLVFQEIQYHGMDYCIGTIKWEVSSIQIWFLSSSNFLANSFVCFSIVWDSYISSPFIGAMPYCFIFHIFICLSSCSIFSMIFSKLFPNFIDVKFSQ